jgi:hypothetical protein
MGATDMVGFLLDTVGISASACDQVLATGLHYAVAFGHVATVRLLAQKQRDAAQQCVVHSVSLIVFFSFF